MKIVLFLVVFMAVCPLAVGQERVFFIGPALSLQHEEGSGRGQFWGAGLRLQKRIHQHWELNAGINAVNRHYQSTEPINLCALQPGVFCHFARYQVESYGYRTIEIPIGINRYLFHRDKWEVYSQVNFLSSFDYQSYYGTMRLQGDGINYFSSSLIAGLGVGYRVRNSVRLIFEPFLRTVYHQRKDPVLERGQDDQVSYFDNYGVNMMVLFSW